MTDTVINTKHDQIFYIRKKQRLSSAKEKKQVGPKFDLLISFFKVTGLTNTRRQLFDPQEPKSKKSYKENTAVRGSE